MSKPIPLCERARLWGRTYLWEPAPAGDAREAGAIFIARWGALLQAGLEA